MHFNKFDIHEWNISLDRFKEIINFYGFKIDDSKQNIQAIYTNALTNLRNDAEKAFRFTPMVLPGLEQVRELSIDKDQKNAFFENCIILYALAEIKREIEHSHAKMVELKKATILYKELLKLKSDEKTNQTSMATQLEQQQQIMLAERQAMFDSCKNDLRNKIDGLKGELKFLQERTKMLEEQREEVFKEHGKQLAKEMDSIMGKNGKPIFEGCTEEQKNTFAENILRKFNKIERDISAEAAEPLARKGQIIDRLSEIKTEKAAIRAGSTLDESRVNGMVTMVYNDTKKISRLDKEESTLNAELSVIDARLAEIKEQKEVLKKEMAEAEALFAGINPDNLHDDIAALIQELSSFKEGNSAAHALGDDIDATKERANILNEEIDAALDIVGEAKFSSSDLEGFEDLDLFESELMDLKDDFAQEFRPSTDDKKASLSALR